MTRNGFKREASGGFPLTAFSSNDNARLIVVRSKVNWSDGGSAVAGLVMPVSFGRGRLFVTPHEGRGWR
jgi:hypothetical protein